jgi:hypothetical protein
MGGNMNARFVQRIILFGVLLLAVSFLTDSHAADLGLFRGTMIANGTRTPFPFGDGRQVFTFKISGHVNLQSNLAKKKDYWAECVGLADSVTGINGRCVWKDLAGPEIYITLLSDRLQQGSKVYGTIVGGTGNLAGISGDMAFSWSSVISQADAEGTVSVTGETRDISGNYRIP